MHTSESIDQLDEHCIAIYLEVPPTRVALFQAYFELYEGLGVVRTLSVKRSLLCVLTSTSQLSTCLEALTSLEPSIGWRFMPRVEIEGHEDLVRSFSNASDF